MYTGRNRAVWCHGNHCRYAYPPFIRERNRDREIINLTIKSERPSHTFPHKNKKIIKNRRRTMVIYGRNEKARDAVSYRLTCCCLLSNIRRHCSVCLLSCLLCHDILTYTQAYSQLYYLCIIINCTSESIKLDLAH